MQGVYPGRPLEFTVVTPDAAIPADGGRVAVGWREATADEAVVVRRAWAALLERDRESVHMQVNTYTDE